MAGHLKIACLTQNPSSAGQTAKLILPNLLLEWEMVLIEPKLAALNSKVTSCREGYDAVVLEGLPCEYRVGVEMYKLDGVIDGEHCGDGAGLRTTLERHLVSQACRLLGSNARDKQVLVLNGLAHYCAAEVLSRVKNKLAFGDLLIATASQAGVPLKSFKALKKSLPEIIAALSSQARAWPWPFAPDTGSTPTAATFAIDAADVVLGDHYAIQGFAPSSLNGKLVFTNLQSENELDWFSSRGVKFVASLTPVVNGKFVPLAVLEAALQHGASDSIYGNRDDYILNQLLTLDLDVAVFDLRGGKPSRVEAKPGIPDATAAPTDGSTSPAVPTGTDGVARFAFVIHPLAFKHINRLKPIRLASQFFSKEVLEDATSHMKSFKAGTVKNIISKTGAKAEGLIYAVPVTSKVMLRKPPEFIYKKLIKVAKKAYRAGCSLMGLGAYTSVVGDAGVTVSQGSPIGITSGNSYTVAATLDTLRTAARRCGKDLSQCNALVIGATGSIGSICSRILAHDVRAIYLVAPRPEKLLSLAKKIQSETPVIKGKVYISRDVNDFLPMADVAISTTSSVDAPIDVTLLKPGCVVCDVARPPDIKKQQALARRDIMVIESGEIKLLDGAVMNYDIGLPPGVIYACLAETMLLALDRRFGHFTLGREIDPAMVELIMQIADKHGFELAEIRSYGEIVPEEHFVRLREVNDRPREASQA